MANLERVRLWVEDLETTDSPQAQGSLHVLASVADPEKRGREDSFCCLGRLCVVAMERGLDLMVLSDGHVVTYNGSVGEPPNRVAEWLGVGPVVFEKYWLMNDRGFTFKEIAVVVRQDFGLEDRG